MKERKIIEESEIDSYVETLKIEDVVGKNKDEVFRDYINENKLNKHIIVNKTPAKQYLDKLICYQLNLEKKKILINNDFYKVVYKPIKKEGSDEKKIRRKEKYFKIADDNNISKLLFYTLIETRENVSSERKEKYLNNVFTDYGFIQMCKYLPKISTQLNNDYINQFVKHKNLISENTLNYCITKIYFILKAYIEKYIEKDIYSCTDGFIREPITIKEEDLYNFMLKNRDKIKNMISKNIFLLYMEEHNILTSEQITNNLNDIKSYIKSKIKKI